MNRLKELRQEKKLSQKEIALELQVPLRTYQRWENGESQIKPDKAQTLADFFEVSVGYLLGYEDDKEKQLDELLNKVLVTEDGQNIPRTDIPNIVIKTENDEEMIKLGRLKIISIVGQVPEKFWDEVGDEVLKMVSVAPVDYTPMIVLWSLMTKSQRTAVLNMLQTFNFDN